MRNISKIIDGLLAVTAFCAAGFCFASPAQAVTIIIPQQEIESQLKYEFPITSENVYSAITLSDPKLTLSKSNGGSLGLVAKTLVEAMGGYQAEGFIHVDGALKYSRETGEFFIANSTVRKVDIEGLSESLQGVVAELATNALRDYFDTNPLFSLKGNSMAISLVNEAIKSISIRDGALVLELSLAK